MHVLNIVPAVCLVLLYCVTISIAAAEGPVVLKNPYENIDWEGDEYAEGLSFNYSQLKDAIVRAQVHLGELIFYSQAFHIGEKD